MKKVKTAQTCMHMLQFAVAAEENITKKTVDNLGII